MQQLGPVVLIFALASCANEPVPSEDDRLTVMVGFEAWSTKRISASMIESGAVRRFEMEVDFGKGANHFPALMFYLQCEYGSCAIVEGEYPLKLNYEPGPLGFIRYRTTASTSYAIDDRFKGQKVVITEIDTINSTISGTFEVSILMPGEMTMHFKYGSFQKVRYYD